MTAPFSAPTHSEPRLPRKPRRLGLYIPWGLAVAAAAAWSLAWMWLSNAELQGMDAAVGKLRAAGWRVAWASRTTGGYPFRLDLDMTGLELADPSGWGVSVPALKTEAYAFAPTHWVFFLPGGRMTVARPGGGPLDVQAAVVRGSVSGVGDGVPNLALELDDAHFAPGPGGAPVLLASTKNLQFYTRPGPSDQGALYVSIDGGAAAPGGWLADLARGAPASLTADATFGHASALAEANWRQGVTAWTRAGGVLQLQHLDLAVGAQHFKAETGDLAVGDDGRLAGNVRFSSPSGPRYVDLYQGGAWIGSERVAAAPRLF